MLPLGLYVCAAEFARRESPFSTGKAEGGKGFTTDDESCVRPIVDGGEIAGRLAVERAASLAALRGRLWQQQEYFKALMEK